jgi:hypothetical protein
MSDENKAPENEKKEGTEDPNTINLRVVSQVSNRNIVYRYNFI